MATEKKEENKITGLRIKEARERTFIIGKNGKQKKLSQAGLAEKLFVSVQAVKNWEQGINAVEPMNLMRISKICGVSLGWLQGVDNTITESFEIAQQLTPDNSINIAEEWRKEEKYQNIMNLLYPFGYSYKKINNLDMFYEYMESTIKNSLDFYFRNINKKR